jgi:transketolase
LLSSLWKTLEEEGHDVEEIQEKIKDTVKKCIITLEPYLTHYYRTNISKDADNLANAKVFHILGLDILIDKKNNAWLMEINSNPSLNIFLERDVIGSTDGTTEKVLQELDKHVKAKVVTEAIRIVTGKGDGEYDGAYEQLLPDSSMDEYYIFNDAQRLFELMVSTS